MIPDPELYFEEPQNTYRYVVDNKLGSDLIGNTLELSKLSGTILPETIRVYRQGLLLTSQSQNATAYDYTYNVGIYGEIIFYEVIASDTHISVFYQVDDSALPFITSSGADYKTLYYIPSGSPIELLTTEDDIQDSEFLEIYVNGLLKREGVDYTVTLPRTVEFLISSLAVPESFISIRYPVFKGTV